jgi:hypothetical protein
MQPAPPSAATATSNVQEISSARAGSTLGDTFDDKPGEVFKKVAAIGRLRGRLCQSALLDDKACDLIDTFAALQIRKNERSLCPHSQRVGFHYVQVCSHQRGQIYLVYDEKVGARNTGAALARYFFTCRDVDHMQQRPAGH